MKNIPKAFKGASSGGGSSGNQAGSRSSSCAPGAERSRLPYFIFCYFADVISLYRGMREFPNYLVCNFCCCKLEFCIDSKKYKFLPLFRVTYIYIKELVKIIKYILF